MGYALAAEEIVAQCPDVAWIVHASGSAGTQAGLLAGLLALGHPARVIGVDVDAQAERVARDVRRVGREAAALLGVGDRWDDARVEVAGAWCGPAYGVPDAMTLEAIGLAGRLEALGARSGLCREGHGGADRAGAGRAVRREGAGGVDPYRWGAGAVRVSGGDGARRAWGALSVGYRPTTLLANGRRDVRRAAAGYRTPGPSRRRLKIPIYVTASSVSVPVPSGGRVQFSPPTSSSMVSRSLVPRTSASITAGSVGSAHVAEIRLVLSRDAAVVADLRRGHEVLLRKGLGLGDRLG